MKKSILTMIIVCCTAMMANAASEPAEVKSPQQLIKALTALYQKYGEAPSTQNIRKNPDTGMTEENSLVIPIKVPKNDPLLREAISAFEQDKDCGYQYLHITPKENKSISIMINNTNINAKKTQEEEMWMLNAKNPDNPALRNNYTMVLSSKADIRTGSIYLVTSMRPEQNNTSITDKPSTGTRDDIYNDKQIKKYAMILETYQNALDLVNKQIENINKQINNFGPTDERKALQKKLYNEAGDIISKMKTIIDKYTESTLK